MEEKNQAKGDKRKHQVIQKMLRDAKMLKN